MRRNDVKVTLRLGVSFRDAIGGKSEITEDANDVADLFERVEKTYPSLREKIFSGVLELRPEVFVYVNGRDLRSLNGLDTKLNDGDVVAVLTAISGG